MLLGTIWLREEVTAVKESEKTFPSRKELTLCGISITSTDVLIPKRLEISLTKFVRLGLTVVGQKLDPNGIGLLRLGSRWKMLRLPGSGVSPKYDGTTSRI